MTASINFWPILVASIVAFGVSALWYSPILFGKDWMALTKMSDRDVETSGGMWKKYVYQLILTIVMYSVLAFLIVASGSRTAGDGAFMGFLVWLGFSLTDALGEMIWMKAPFKLVLISSVNSLINFLVGGAIIGAWK